MIEGGEGSVDERGERRRGRPPAPFLYGRQEFETADGPSQGGRDRSGIIGDRVHA